MTPFNLNYFLLEVNTVYEYSETLGVRLVLQYMDLGLKYLRIFQNVDMMASEDGERGDRERGEKVLTGATSVLTARAFSLCLLGQQCFPFVTSKVV